MVYTCKSICLDLSKKNPISIVKMRNARIDLYESKTCGHCEVRFLKDIIFGYTCPCCGCNLRRAQKLKGKSKDANKMKRY